MDEYDIARTKEALKTLESVRDYYFDVYSNRLYNRLDTVCRKIQKILKDCEVMDR